MGSSGILLFQSHNRHLSSRGFSMLEILLSLAFISVMILTLIEVLFTGHLSIRQGNEIITATNVAQTVLDRSRQMGYSELPAGSSFDGRTGTTGTKYFPPQPYPKVEEAGITYYINISVTDLDVTNSTKKIDVEISWDARSAFSYEKAGGTEKVRRTLTMTTIVSKVY